MRLWSIHPEYLDSRGFVALWREGLLARAALAGKAKGYRHHPQLERFKETKCPVSSINAYLRFIFEEALRRGYSFDKSRLGRARFRGKIKVSRGQIEYEFTLLKKKLARRSPAMVPALDKVEIIKPHPLFSIIAGSIEEWEKT